jgi:DNA (cytosine-5)-methyltransferase 3A
MDVLSLCDGISCGQVALGKVNINISKYYAAEINQDAISVAKTNFPDMIHIGDMTKVSGYDYKDIDLLIAGTPCQDLSHAKTDGKGLDGDKSGLFYHFVRILKECNPKYFFLENVKMKKEWEDIITSLLGVKPIKINSNLVSAQNRERLYWTNIPNITSPNNMGILIKDIIFDDNYKIFTDERIDNTRIKTKNYWKWDLSGKKYWSQQDRAYFKDGKMCTVPKANPSNKLNIWLGENKYRRCHPIEAERLQTLPDNYTSCIKSHGKRIGLCGDGWTVDVIAHIFKGISSQTREEVNNG